MKKTFFTIFLAFLTVTAFAQKKVTFRADMSVQILKGNFTIGTDYVVVRGDFQMAAGDTVNWDGDV